MYGLDLPLGSSARAQLLREVKRDCRLLLSEPADWSIGLGHLLHAGLVVKFGALEQAHMSLTMAEERFESAGMALHATISRRARGRVMGGEQGAALIEAADAWLHAHRVAQPAGFHRMIAGWT